MNTGKISVLSLMLQITVYASTANSAPILEEMNLHTMLESTSSVLTTLGDYSVLNPDGITNGTANTGGRGISWTGTFSSSGWNYSGTGIFGGLPLSMNYSGTLSGSDGADITVAISGTGSLGSQPLLMSGSTQWFYDTATNDYLTMAFAQETKIGADSRWGWVVGTERIFCVGEGTVSGVIAGESILVAVASSGKRSALGSGIKTCFAPTSPDFFKKGSLTISKIRKSALNELRHAAPLAPALPSIGDLFNSDNQGTVVADDGGLYADDMSNRYRTNGIRGSGGTPDVEPTVVGTTTSIPEPATVWIVCVGLMGLLGTRRRIAKFPAIQVLHGVREGRTTR